MVEAAVEIREAVSKGFSILDGTEGEVDFEDSRRRGMDGMDMLDELVLVWFWCWCGSGCGCGEVVAREVGRADAAVVVGVVVVG